MKIKSILISTLIATSNFFLFAKSDSELTKIKRDLTSISNKSSTSNITQSFVLHVIFANPNNQYPIELWTGRTKSPKWTNLDFYDIAKEIQNLHPLVTGYLKKLNADEMSIILQRLEHMSDVAQRALLMQSKDWKSQYADVLNKHIIGIRKAGISDLFPKELLHTLNNCEDQLVRSPDYCDSKLSIPLEDKIQSEEQIIEEIEKQIISYIDHAGGNYELIKDFKRNQGLDSWFETCRDVKIYFQKQRNFPLDSYYWGTLEEDLNAISGTLNRKNLEVLEVTIPIWHAFTQEFLRCTNFLHNNQENQQICLTRFDGLSTFENAQETNNSQYRLKRAVYDSYTLLNFFHSPNNYKSEIISMQQVDHINIFDCYFFRGYFAEQKRETEFIALVGPESDTYLGGAVPYVMRETSRMPAGIVKQAVSKILSENWCSADNAISLEEARRRANLKIDGWCAENEDDMACKYISAEKNENKVPEKKKKNIETKKQKKPKKKSKKK